MDWLFLLLAVILEPAWAWTLKESEGFTIFLPSLAAVVVTLISCVCISQALKIIPMGILYSALTGLGAIATVLIEAHVYGVPYDLSKIIFMSIIVCGVIGLNLVS